ncbi:MAG: leucine-rich repeat protein [Firmicutes bacterium]|nr:leucine-rich repeat protein [Bacillota bacterium]
MICPKCGKYVADYSLYCWACGQSLTPPQPAREPEPDSPEEEVFDRETITEEAAPATVDGTDEASEEEFDEESYEKDMPAADDGQEEYEETDAEAAAEELSYGAPDPEDGTSPEATEAAHDPAPAKTANIKPAPDKVSYKPLRNLILGALALALILLCWFLLLSPSARYDRNMHKAEACMEQSDYQGALDHYSKAAALEPTADALQGRAAACLNLGDTDGALACYRQLLEQDTEREGTYAALAEVYQARGEYREALAALDEGIQATASTRLQQQLDALLTQLGITNYTADEVAAADNIWPVGKVSAGGGPGRALATDIDVVAVLDKASGLLTVSRNGLDSDGVMADLALYEGAGAEARDSFLPWLEQTDGGVPITGVEIGGGVVNIGAGAFSGCEELAKVSIGADVSEIGQAAFAGCLKLSEVEIAEDSRLTKLGPSVFRDCAGLHQISLPDRVESLGENCFYASGLLELTLPAALTLLNQGALNNCPVLATVNVNTAMTDLGLVPFYRCPELTAINVASDNRSYSSFDGLLYDKSGATLLRCPEGRESCSFAREMTAVGERAFYACAKLTGVDLPDGLASLGREAFAFCPNLSYVYLPASLETVGSRAFVYCGSLERIVLAEGNRSFRMNGDMLLTEDGATLVCCPPASGTGRSGGVMRLPKAVTAVAEGACVGCNMSGLICTGVKEIGASAFADCSSLSSAMLPESVTSIGYGAFNGSSELVIYCKGGSYAEEYAKTAGYQVQKLNDFVMNFFN